MYNIEGQEEKGDGCISVLLMTANHPNKNGEVYSSKALVEMSKDNPRLKYKNGRLYQLIRPN